VPDDTDDRPVVVRVLMPALTTVVVLPALLFYGLYLAWFPFDATGYTCGADDPGCRRDPVDTVVWWLVLAAAVGAAVSLGLTWWRQWHAGWWRCPAFAVGFVAVGALVLSVLSRR
jgi:hypothetical protein